MVSRKGSLLEKNVEKMLKLSGFNPELNKIIKDYEIDIFLMHKGQKIAFECKQYERSSLVVRNLIHQWDSKNKELGFDRIILVLVGIDVQEKDYEFAKKYGIIIWDENKLTRLLDMAIEDKTKNKDKILRELNIKPENKIKVEFKDTTQSKEIENFLTKFIVKKDRFFMVKKGNLFFNGENKYFAICGDDSSSNNHRELGIRSNYKGFIIEIAVINEEMFLEEINETFKSLKFKPKKIAEGGTFGYGELNSLGINEYVYINASNKKMHVIFAQFSKEDVERLAHLCDFIFKELAGFEKDYSVSWREYKGEESN